MNKIIFTPQNPEGLVVAMTAEEIAEVETEQTAEEVKQAEKEAAATQKALDEANGNQKLLDLGLTQAEATALTGYIPPVEE